MKLQAWKPAAFLKRLFPCEYCEIFFKNTYFEDNLYTAASYHFTCCPIKSELYVKKIMAEKIKQN